MYQRGTPFMDGTSWVTQCPIPPNSSFQYKFLANQTGTYWYHGHTLTNYVDGLYGAFIIHDPNDPYAGQYDEEIVMLVGDWHHYDGFDLLATFMSDKNPSGEEPSPNSIIINGVGQANCSDLNSAIISEDSSGSSGGDDDDDDGPKGLFADKHHTLSICNTNVIPSFFLVSSNSTYRLRIINTSAFTRMLISIDGHPLTVIEADGTPTQRFSVDQLRIDVAQRYSVLFTANQASGRYTIHASADVDMGFTLNGMAVLQYNGIYGGTSINVPVLSNPVVLDPFNLRPLTVQPAPGPVVENVQLDMVFNDDSKMVNMAYLNNSTYMAPATPAIYTAYHNGQFDVSTNVYTLANQGIVQIVLNNRDEGDHPFHLHGHKVAVLGIGNPGDGDYDPNNSSQVLNLDNPLWRDVVTVHQSSYLVLRVVADNPGVWLMHCHIEWHMEAGLAVVFNELPSLQPSAYTLPDFVPSQCLSPVAPPNMEDPKSYGGTYLASAPLLSASALFVFVATFVSILLM